MEGIFWERLSVGLAASAVWEGRLVANISTLAWPQIEGHAPCWPARRAERMVCARPMHDGNTSKDCDRRYNNNNDNNDNISSNNDFNVNKWSYIYDMIW